MKFSIIKMVNLCLLISMLGGAIGCSSGKDRGENQSINVGKAQDMWEKQEAIIIDVRTQAEYDQGHIPRVALIPLDQLGTRLGEVPKEEKVLIICRSGSRSLQATQLLRDKGYMNVYNITEGMNGWKGPLEK